MDQGTRKGPRVEETLKDWRTAHLVRFMDQVHGRQPTSLPSFADLAHLGGYALIAAGIWLLIGRRMPGNRLAPLVETFAVGVAGSMVLWLL